MDPSLFWLPPVNRTQIFILDPVVSTAASGTIHIPAYNTPLNDKLIALKNEIDSITPAGVWDDAKKITNPYEYVFLSLQRRMAGSVAKIQPLSRSFFKMIELWDLLAPVGVRGSAHTAEGPGGFLEAIQYRCPRIPMVAMTLKSNERSVPGWKKSRDFLLAHPSVQVTYGADNTGNLYNHVNHLAFTQVVETKMGKVDVYTADGGFDFSADFNGQENNVQRLLVAEALAGLTCLQTGEDSIMILKLFDTKCQATLDFLWMLSSCFQKTALVKPQTSRPANSERYWIGKGFRGVDDWMLEFFKQLTEQEVAICGWDRLLLTETVMDAGWLSTLQRFQEQMEEQQAFSIQQTLALIREPIATRNSHVLSLLTKNIQYSRIWCMKHNIAINHRYVGVTDESAAHQALEEAMEGFQQLDIHSDWLGSHPCTKKHRVWSLPPSQRTPTEQVWRSPIPASVLGRLPSETSGGTPPLPLASVRQSPPWKAPVVGRIEPLPPLLEQPQMVARFE